MWCDVIYDVIRCDAMWYDTMLYDAMWYDAMWCNGMWYDAMWCNVMWYDTIWCNVIRCDVIQWDVIWCSIYCRPGFDLLRSITRQKYNKEIIPPLVISLRRSINQLKKRNRSNVEVNRNEFNFGSPLQSKPCLQVCNQENNSYTLNLSAALQLILYRINWIITSLISNKCIFQ